MSRKSTIEAERLWHHWPSECPRSQICMEATAKARSETDPLGRPWKFSSTATDAHCASEDSALRRRRRVRKRLRRLQEPSGVCCENSDDLCFLRSLWSAWVRSSLLTWSRQDATHIAAGSSRILDGLMPRRTACKTVRPGWRKPSK